MPPAAGIGAGVAAGEMGAHREKRDSPNPPAQYEQGGIWPLLLVRRPRRRKARKPGRWTRNRECNGDLDGARVRAERGYAGGVRDELPEYRGKSRPGVERLHHGLRANFLRQNLFHDGLQCDGRCTSLRRWIFRRSFGDRFSGTRVRHDTTSCAIVFLFVSVVVGPEQRTKWGQGTFDHKRSVEVKTRRWRITQQGHHRAGSGRRLCDDRRKQVAGPVFPVRNLHGESYRSPRDEEQNRRRRT
mmetsp:Transcript_27914/g.70574  ORF Transcript_27914/g.70574 Transcript_27914/m.70574 type:complete len:243 (+) Transcript_27914:128-856(+)